METIQTLMDSMNAQFMSQRDDLVNHFMNYGQTANHDKILDFCEELEEMRTWGEVAETLVEMELCEPYDLPYLMTIIMNDAKNVRIFFEEA